MKRFPLFDNFYDPSRQSADGHQWITEAMAPYADDIQSPDWVRSYPGGNAGDALAYQNKGFLFSEAAAAGLSVKIYGEYVENDTFLQPNGSTSEPSWSDFYTDALRTSRLGKEKTLYYQNTVQAESSVPAVSNHLIKNFPQFDLGIPDQFRVDLWVQDFNNDVAAGTVPTLSILWIMDDHTGGPPTPDAEQADNDLAVGRMIDYISHSNVWSTSAIFIEEDDAQNGVDHVDGHRSPGYIVSPYVVQNGPTDHTYYTQVNMTRTIEQILGLPPMNQFDLVASPMRTAFVKGTPPADNFQPWTHVPNQVPLDQGVTAGRSQHQGQRRGQGPEEGLAPEEGGDLRRQTDQARLRRPGHRQPSELVPVHRVYAALSRREQGSPSERLQQPGTRQNGRRRLKHVAVATALSPITGERVFCSCFKHKVPTNLNCRGGGVLTELSDLENESPAS